MATSPLILNNPILTKAIQDRQLQQPQETPVGLGQPPAGYPSGPSTGFTGLSERPAAPAAPVARTLAPPMSAQPLAKVAPPAPLPAELGHQTEYNRLTGVGPDPNQGKSGISQIHNPVGRTLLQIADAIGGGLFPSIAMGIPGTELHHRLLVNHERGALDQEQTNRKQTSLEQEEAARANELNAQPELTQAKNELGLEKLNETTRAHQATEDINRTKAEGQTNATLAQHGFKKDETGQIVPLAYEEMSEPQQAIHDLKAAQSEQAQATAALRKAQAENQPAMAKLAQQRLQSAQEAHSIAMRRLGLSEMQTEGRLFGTHNGEPLPGTIQTDEGKPVGSAFQQNVRPTGLERNKADMAQSAKEQISDIRKIVEKRPDIFGPAAGRKTDFTVWVGSQDPDAQAFRAARTIAGDHLAGTFGGRSETALKELDSAIGHFKDNPAAIARGLDQIEKANEVFIKRGAPRTTGSNVAAQANAVPYTINGKSYSIPASEEKEFLKDHPEAKKGNGR